MFLSPRRLERHIMRNGALAVLHRVLVIENIHMLVF